MYRICFLALLSAFLANPVEAGLFRHRIRCQPTTVCRCPTCKCAQPVPPTSEAPMAAKKNQLRFELYQDQAKEWRWRLVHRNGNIMADSGEGYKRPDGAMRGIERLMHDVGSAPVTKIAK